ncbi:hypothetical protein EZV62_018428 [Acer yangbiense]|uniref:RNase H type-1 domain-containing protein n=1 Tax=Acer yangbiense TaxID=1000413 RepID=A0A5C7HK03_9ROSI|nr:hypothetical protein EZV62_018428 [Acer yangbiense]
MTNVKAGDGMHFIEFMIACMNQLRKEDFGLVCVIIWRIWYYYNGKVHGSVMIPEKDVVPWAADFITDFRSATGVEKVFLGVNSIFGIAWRPPDERSYKMNTDAAIDSAFGRVGFGVIIRDHVGSVLASSSQFLAAFFSPMVAEAMAIFRGLEFTRDSSLLPCTVVLDAQVVVRLINSDVPLSEVGIVVSGIRRLLYCEQGCSVIFAPRLADVVAHQLAKIGVSAVRNSFWMEVVQPEVVPLVLGDCPSSL